MFCVNVARAFEKASRHGALVRTPGPLDGAVLMRVSDLAGSTKRTQEVEPRDFPCVRIIERDLVSQGPQVARLLDRSYVAITS